MNQRLPARLKINQAQVEREYPALAERLGANGIDDLLHLLDRVLKEPTDDHARAMSAQIYRINPNI